MNKFLKLLTVSFLVSFWALVPSDFKAHLADGWYPQDAKKLSASVRSLALQAQEQFGMITDGTKIRALIVPHAGHEYSGAIAMAAYRLCPRNFYDCIIILVPSHTGLLSGIAVPDFSAYRISTGLARIDTDSIAKLLTDSLCVKNRALFASEHAFEVQLPLILQSQPHARFIPLIMGHLQDAEINRVAQLLGSIITPKTLVVVSSDLTHYGARFNYVPFSDNIHARLRLLDSSILLPLQYNDVEQFKSILEKTRSTVCGTMPLEILMKLIRNNVLGAVNTRLVAYGNSCTISHDDSHIVSYAGLIVTQESSFETLNMYEKRSLLTMARAVLTASFDKRIDNNLLMPVLTRALERNAGVFVTLYTRHGATKALRGCIGAMSASRPIYKTVAEMVLSAAHDPRFAPVTRKELESLIIEVSILTAPVPIVSYRDIVLNKHGIILTIGAHSALFLPKVPREHGFDLESALSHLSEKAGLDKNAWQLPEAKFQVFEAIDFSE